MKNHPISVTVLAMEIKLSAKGTGACPLCQDHNKCEVQNAFKKAMKPLPEKDSMEVVIYQCPRFKEKF